MFRAHRADHQERQIVSIQPLVAVTLCRVQVGSSLPTCTRHGHRQLPEVVLSQFVSPDDQHDVLETGRELKSKDVSRQPEVTQGVPGRLRPRIFLMFRHYKGGRSSAKRTGRLYPRRNHWYSLSEAESTSGRMVLSGVALKKSPVTPPGIDPGTSRLVAQCLNHYDTPCPARNM